jgi:hypothetical protein
MFLLLRLPFSGQEDSCLLGVGRGVRNRQTVSKHPLVLTGLATADCSVFFNEKHVRRRP